MTIPSTLRMRLVLAPVTIAFLASCTAQTSAPVVTSPPTQPSTHQAAVAVVAPMPPPPPLAEPIPPMPPGPDGYFAWNPGHYHWGGQGTGFVWMPGNYSERPNQGSVWTMGGWTNQNGVWGYTPSNWQ